MQLPQQLDLPKFPVFPSNVSVENDASLAKVRTFLFYAKFFSNSQQYLIVFSIIECFKTNSSCNQLHVNAIENKSITNILNFK